jgi:hypothetical protein
MQYCYATEKKKKKIGQLEEAGYSLVGPQQREGLLEAV